MFHTQLIAISFSNRAILVSPAIPDVTVKIMNIIGFLLPDPEDLIHGAFQRSFTKSKCREFLAQIVTVHNSETFNGISRGTIFPHRAHLFSLCTGSIFNYVFTHVNKYIVC